MTHSTYYCAALSGAALWSGVESGSGPSERASASEPSPIAEARRIGGAAQWTRAAAPHIARSGSRSALAVSYGRGRGRACTVAHTWNGKGVRALGEEIRARLRTNARHGRMAVSIRSAERDWEREREKCVVERLDVWIGAMGEWRWRWRWSGEKGENLPAHAMQADADIYLTTKIRFVVFPVEIRNHMFMDKVSRTRGYDIPPPSTTKWKWIKGASAMPYTYAYVLY